MLPDRALGGVAPESLPLYGSEHVEDWSKGALVVLVEGEKATEALLGAGIPALGTVTGVSGTPGPEALEVLRGRRVVLWPDNDEPGREHMERIADALVSMAAEVRMYEWQGAVTND
jgi:putative DNA primase/helicase